MELNEKQISRIAGDLGIARKAGQIAAGDNLTKDALQKGKAFMLVLAEDAAPSVREELTAMAEEQELPVLSWTDKIDLGLIIGKSRRGALAVLDKGFADAINKVVQAEK